MPWPFELISNLYPFGPNELQAYEKNRQEGFLCDFSLLSNDGASFPIHRAFVCLTSNKLCDEDFDEQQHDEMKLNVDKKVLEMVLCWIYTQRLILPNHMIANAIMEAASELQIESLKDAAKDSLLDNFDASNVFDCIKFECSDIQAGAEAFICWNFRTLVTEKSSEFCNLSFHHVEKILKNDRLNVYSEDDVWKAVQVWSSANPERSLRNLLSVVRLGLVCEETFIDIQHHIDDESEIPEHMQYPQSALPRRREFFAPRWPEKVIIMVISCQGLSPVTEVYSYDVKSDMWTRLGPKFKFRTLSVASHPVNHTEIALLVSQSTSEWNYGVVLLDVETFELTRLSTLYNTTPIFSRHPTLLNHGGKLSLHQANRYVETYLSDENKWKLQTLLTLMDDVDRDEFLMLREATFAVISGEVYSIGGQMVRGTSTEIRRFNEDDCTYNTVANLMNGRCFAGACEHEGKLVIVGGYTGGEFVMSSTTAAEEYNPKKRTVRELPSSDLSSTFYPSMASIEGGILMVENAYDLAPLLRNHKRRVQFYDPIHGKWEWKKCFTSSKLCSSQGVVEIRTQYIKNLYQFFSLARYDAVKEQAEKILRGENEDTIYDLSDLFEECVS